MSAAVSATRIYEAILDVLAGQSTACLYNEPEREEVAQALLPVVSSIASQVCIQQVREAYDNGFNAGLDRAIELVRGNRNGVD